MVNLTGGATQITDANAFIASLNTSGTNTLTAGGNINATGTFTNLSASTTGPGAGISASSSAPALTVTGASTSNGPITLGNAVGNLVLNGNITSGTGTLSTSASGTQTLAGGVVNTGNFILSGSGMALTGGTLNVTNLLTISTGATLTGGTGTLNAGTANIANGGVLNAGGATLNINTTNVQPGGTLNGTGTVNGSVFNSGIVSPGNSPGLLTITGNLDLLATGLLNIELSGSIPVTGYDRVAVGGSATLGGTLGIAQLNGFLPAFGDGFQFLTANGGVNGAFSQVLLPTAFAGMVLNYSTQFTELFKPLPGLLGQNMLIAASQPIVFYDDKDIFKEEDKMDVSDQLCR